MFRWCQGCLVCVCTQWVWHDTVWGREHRESHAHLTCSCQPYFYSLFPVRIGWRSHWTCSRQFATTSSSPRLLWWGIDSKRERRSSERMYMWLISFCVWQILFLNKVDRFQEKVMGTDRHLRLFFPHYTGTCVEWTGVGAPRDVSIAQGLYLVWILLLWLKHYWIARMCYIARVCCKHLVYEVWKHMQPQAVSIQNVQYLTLLVCNTSMYPLITTVDTVCFCRTWPQCWISW